MRAKMALLRCRSNAVDVRRIGNPSARPEKRKPPDDRRCLAFSSMHRQDKYDQLLVLVVVHTF